MHIYGRKIFSDTENPITIFYKLKSKFKDISILESVIGGENKGRYSIIFFNIVENIKIYENHAIKNNKKVKRVRDLRNYDYIINQFKKNIVLLLSFLPFWSKLAPQKYKHFSLKTYLYYKNRKQPKQSINEFKDRINYLKKISSYKKDLQVKTYKKNVFEIS